MKFVQEAALETRFSLENWSAHELHPSTPDDATVDWIFVLDSLNFSFWSQSQELFTGVLCVAGPLLLF